MPKGKKNPLLSDDIDLAVATVGYEDISDLEENFQELIKVDPKYALSVDPENIYNFSDLEKEFIEQMVQYRNVQFVSTVMLNISVEEGVAIYKSYKVQCEIKRINKAMYARRFARKMADLDQIGGFLTSAMTDENVPVADRLSAKDKLTAAKLLTNINILKQKTITSPQVVETIEVQKDLDKLSPKDLKKLIELNDEDDEEKEKLITLINQDNLLTMEELKNLRLMTVEELNELLITITEGEIDNDGKED